MFVYELYLKDVSLIFFEVADVFIRYMCLGDVGIDLFLYVEGVVWYGYVVEKYSV